MDLKMVQLVAGTGSSLIFIGSNFPMLLKALTTRNLQSYSLAQISLANTGNLIYWFYVIGLPVGPIWFLHAFNTAVALIMLALYLRFEWMSKKLHTQRPFFFWTKADESRAA
jgi:hypothetical protein